MNETSMDDISLTEEEELEFFEDWGRLIFEEERRMMVEKGSEVESKG